MSDSSAQTEKEETAVEWDWQSSGGIMRNGINVGHSTRYAQEIAAAMELVEAHGIVEIKRVMVTPILKAAMEAACKAACGCCHEGMPLLWSEKSDEYKHYSHDGVQWGEACEASTIRVSYKNGDIASWL